MKQLFDRSAGSRLRFRPLVQVSVALGVLGLLPAGFPGGPIPALGHESRPGYLELREVEAGIYRMLWKKPTGGEVEINIAPVLPEGCTLVGVGSEDVRAQGAYVARGTFKCTEGLSGQTIRIAGLETTITDVLIRIYHENGQQETHLVQPTRPSVEIGGATGVGRRIVAYLQLGIEHIALGVDHLLFVLGLLLIVSTPMMLLKTITSFTIAHSITLAVATLGHASAPMLPLNAVIALSILFLGPEIVRTWRGETSFTIRHPWVVAFAFGLLHGFGFATGLSSMGLPQGEIPMALLFFNVGVEIGQLLFVGLVLALARSFKVLEIRWPRWAQVLPGYAVGTLGAFWFIQRTVVLLGWM